MCRFESRWDTYGYSTKHVMKIDIAYITYPNASNGRISILHIYLWQDTLLVGSRDETLFGVWHRKCNHEPGLWLPRGHIAMFIWCHIQIYVSSVSITLKSFSAPRASVMKNVKILVITYTYGQRGTPIKYFAKTNNKPIRIFQTKSFSMIIIMI